MNINDLKELEQKASPGPWGYCVQCPSEDAEELEYCACGPIHTAMDNAEICPEFDQAEADSKFIRAFRNLMPELLALWEAARNNDTAGALKRLEDKARSMVG